MTLCFDCLLTTGWGRIQSGDKQHCPDLHRFAPLRAANVSQRVATVEAHADSTAVLFLEKYAH
jgi:hypothetical protein